MTIARAVAAIARARAHVATAAVAEGRQDDRTRLLATIDALTEDVAALASEPTTVLPDPATLHSFGAER